MRSLSCICISWKCTTVQPETRLWVLWQLAQASTVLKCPVQSVFPQIGDDVMRRDFHRTFFPVGVDEYIDTEPVYIMWTGPKEGYTPDHFVPLIKKNLHKYDIYDTI